MSRGGKSQKLAELLEAVKEVCESTDEEFVYTLPNPLSSAMLSLGMAWQEYSTHDEKPE